MSFSVKTIKNIDWDFLGAETQYLTHKYHTYPARFIPQIPRTIYNLFLKKENYRTFDPFMGCGTSVVESILSRNHAGGIDLNPLAVLISRVKTRALDILQLKNSWKNFQLHATKKSPSYNQQTFVFPKRNLSVRFTDDTTQNFSLILNFISNKISDSDIQDFFKVGVSSTVTTLVESKKWRKVNIWRIFQAKINSMIQIMEIFNPKVIKFSNELQEGIKIGDSRNIDFIPEESIDCIVTSPPFVNALDYNRIHQYNMSILGYNYRKFAKNEIGAHGHHISNRWRLLTEYLADMFQSLSEMARIVKNGSVICIVIGDSCIEYERIKSHSHFKNIGESLGLTHQISLQRNIDTTRKSTSKDIGNIFSEYLIFFTKNDELGSSSRKEWYEFIEKIMLEYLDHVKTSKGTCLRNKPALTEERQELAVQRVEEALSKIKEDCPHF